MSAAAPVTLFYSYAHEDEALRDELQGHLKLLERRGLLAPWHDRRIVAGADWSGAIDGYLRTAELVLLLVSKDFIESDYIWGTELAVAMQRHTERAVVVVPIIVRAVDLDPDDVADLPFLKLQALPTDMKPVTSWPNRDEAWTNVAKGLCATVKTIRESRLTAAEFPDAGAICADASLSRSMVELLRRPFGAPRHGTDGASQVEQVVVDPLLERVVADVSQQIEQAGRLRSAPPLSASGAAVLQAQTRSLIDLTDQQRVLWVDDRPEGNRFEIAALAKLQIEVLTARSTDEALQVIAADTEGFGLVISDWERAGEPAQAGLRLLARLPMTGVERPQVFYHGEQSARRVQRAAKACAAGALGEAVLPDELMTLVLQALQVGPAPHPRPLATGARE